MFVCPAKITIETKKENNMTNSKSQPDVAFATSHRHRTYNPTDQRRTTHDNVRELIMRRLLDYEYSTSEAEDQLYGR